METTSLFIIVHCSLSLLLLLLTFVCSLSILLLHVSFSVSLYCVSSVSYVIYMCRYILLIATKKTHIYIYSETWRRWFDEQRPETKPCPPGTLAKLKSFPRLLVLRALRPDRLLDGKLSAIKQKNSNVENRFSVYFYDFLFFHISYAFVLISLFLFLSFFVCLIVYFIIAFTLWSSLSHRFT
mgnify:CR=1 FL=1